METDKTYEISEYTLEELEQFRDENGFIDLSKAGVILTEASREIRGYVDRIKNWVDFRGTRALIKGELIRDQEKDYGIYAELIVEEIAKRLGVETAHYDLIRINGDDGEPIFGVLSQSVVDVTSGEELVSLHSLIRSEVEEESDFMDTTKYEYTVKRLEYVLLKDGYDVEQVQQVISDYKKRLAFATTIIDTDKHTENVAFIKRTINGKKTIRLSPNFDSESALMLDTRISLIQKLLEDYLALRESVDLAHPKIGTIKKRIDGGEESLWKDTLNALCEEDEIYYYCTEVLIEQLDMDEILDSVEARIKAPLPKDVRTLVIGAYTCRNKQMSTLLAQGLGENTFLESIIELGVEQGIKTGEQIEIGQSMQKDIEKGDSKDQDQDMKILMGLIFGEDDR